MNDGRQRFAAPFKDGGKICWPLVGIFLLLNGIVLYNALFHFADIQYDSIGHLANIRVIAGGHLPSEAESVEFFSAPLPYLLPALILRLTGLPILQVAKIAQLINVLLSLALSYTLLKLADELFPGRVSARLIALGMLALLPVYYRTFAYPRGEPYVALLTLVACYLAIRLLARTAAPPPNGATATTREAGWGGAVLLGLILGLDVLARQWAFFFFPALFIFAALCVAADRSRFKQILVRLALAGLVAALVGGWFYLYLYRRFGSITAFNRSPGEQFLANQPDTFYTGTGNGYLFSKPVRPLLSNQVVPILYADTWGDYWGYFLIEGISAHSHTYELGVYFERALRSPGYAGMLTNYDTFGAYLGRVNLVSLLPTMLFLAGLLYGLWELIIAWRPARLKQPVEASLLLTLTLVFTLGGYLWFLVTYPSVEAGGTTIKATYILQIYPLFALLVANLFEKLSFLRAKEKWLWGLSLIFLHNFPALLTHYFANPWK
jgi:4-amino-4-deoxy-L-arabinose transferase-like glycosyltransferase